MGAIRKKCFLDNGIETLKIPKIKNYLGITSMRDIYLRGVNLKTDNTKRKVLVELV